MDFDFTTETITPDSTNILTIGGTGALELPSGTTGQQPVSGLAAGAMRWNTTSTQMEYYSGSAWSNFGGSVTSVNASGGTTGLTFSGGPITTSGTLTLSGTLSVSNGGTGATTLTQNGVLYGNGTGAVGSTSAGTTGQVLIATTGSAPSWGTLSGVSVTSFQTSLSGLTPSTSTTGAITLAGTLGATSGGTGTTTAPTAGQLLVGQTGGTYVPFTVTSGTGISTTTGSGTFQINNTGVTSNIAGTGISVSGATGAVTITNTGVTSLTGTANQVNVSASTGAVTLSLPQNIATSSSPTFASVTISNAPSAGTDAATKNYVDAAIAGLSWKQAVRAATTTAGTLATSFANGSVIDGVTLATGDRILIKNQATQTENGIYIVQASGAPVRSSDADTGAELVGASVYVDQGTANADTGWTQTTAAPITIGSSNIVWAQFSGSGSYTAGTGLTLTGNQFSLTSPVSATLGGSGTTSAPSAGQFLYSAAGTSYAPTALSSVAVTTFAGGTTGLTPASATSGAITLAGTLAVANGGTGLTSTPTNGQIDIGNGTGFTRTTLTQGAGITITSGSGSITVANAGVTSISFGTTGLTPNTATTGAVTVAGTLALANGGTNASLTAVNGGVVYSSGTAMAITAAGTSGQYLQSNGAAAPTWVTLTNGGLSLYRENPSTPTTPSATGTNAVAIGNGSAASGTNAIGLGQGTSASIFGTKAIANGNTATAGDAQEVIGVLRNTTSNNTQTELFLDGTGATQRLVLPNNSAWTFTLKIVARRTDATGSLGSWIFQGLIYKDATAGTTTISGTSKTTVARIGSIVAGNDPVVDNDTTNGSLRVRVTGNNAQTYRWVATCYLTQVTN